MHIPPDWTTYIHPGGWKYYYNPTLKICTDFSMDISAGQDEFRRANQETNGGVPPPDGWETWLDAGMSCDTIRGEITYYDLP